MPSTPPLFDDHLYEPEDNHHSESQLYSHQLHPEDPNPSLHHHHSFQPQDQDPAILPSHPIASYQPALESVEVVGNDGEAAPISTGPPLDKSPHDIDVSLLHSQQTHRPEPSRGPTPLHQDDHTPSFLADHQYSMRPYQALPSAAPSSASSPSSAHRARSPALPPPHQQHLYHQLQYTYPDHPFSSFGSHYQLHQPPRPQSTEIPNGGHMAPLRALAQDVDLGGRPMIPNATAEFSGRDDTTSRRSSLGINLAAVNGSGIGGRATPPQPQSATATGVTSGATTQITPIKDQNGKFPCPHCNKDYLHAKHLKRHLLRHTGDRPYRCCLCNDTFSRSDILKRHFQKCSIRRGNPLGLSHLEASQGNQRRKAKEAQAQLSRSPSTSGGERRSPGDGRKNNGGKACDLCVKMKVKCTLGIPCERCAQKGARCTYEKNHGISLADAHAATQVLQGYHGQGGILDTVQGYGEGYNFPPHMAQHGHHIYQHRVGAPGQPRLKTSGPPSPQSSSQYYNGHQPAHPTEDWASFVQPQTDFHDSPYYAQPPGIIPNPVEASLPPTAGGMYSVLYEPAWRFEPQYPPFPKMSPPMSPLQTRYHQLIDLLFVRRTTTPVAPPWEKRAIYAEDNGDDLKPYITPQNIKDFVKLYFINFQNHFPMLHVPTFDISRTSDYLLLTMFCVGAVYSTNGITHDQVRRLIDFTFNALIDRINHESAYSPAWIPTVEDAEALQLLHVLFTWHGNSEQRRFALRNYRNVAELAKRARLFAPLTAADIGPENVSDYHQLRFDPNLRKTWNWNTWIEQEKRNRCALTVYLLDTAYVIYFNVMPCIRTHDIRVTMPCDDAAWDADTAEKCSIALGLMAPKPEDPLPTAPRYPTQPEFLNVLRVLMNPSGSLGFCTTNVQTKFIILHALHVQIYYYHRYHITHSKEIVADWIRPSSYVPTPPSTANGTSAPPQQPPGTTPHDPYLTPSGVAVFRENIKHALESWRKAWETDIAAQIPDPYDRVGYSKDGMPYYYLATHFIREPSRERLGFGPGGEDTNVGVVVGLLNQMREANGRKKLLRDDEGRGGEREHPGSGGMKGVKKQYGVEELLFDMKLLFRPVIVDEQGKISEEGKTQADERGVNGTVNGGGVGAAPGVVNTEGTPYGV